MYKEVNVTFEHMISGSECVVMDEVQFDINTDGSPIDVMNEILGMSNDYFTSQGYHEVRIIGVEEE